MEGGKSNRPRRTILATTIMAMVIVSFSLGYLLGKSSAHMSSSMDGGESSEKTSVSEPRLEILPSPTSPTLTTLGAKEVTGSSPRTPAQETATFPVTSGELSSSTHAPPGDSPPPSRSSKPVKPKYTIQVGSFQDRESAERLALELESKGFDAYVEKAQIPGRGVWYRVRVGTFETKAEAQAWAERNLEKIGRRGFPTTRSFP
jgi:cell division protein FtsN